MKTLLILSLFLFTSLAHSDFQYGNVFDNSLSFSSGYVLASFYDAYVYEKKLKVENSDYLKWKLGLGFAGGFLMSIHDADRDNGQLKLNEICFGILGGLTSVSFHF